MIEQVLNCRKCDLHINQNPLLDKNKKCDVMWVGLSAKKVEDLNINYPLENNTNSGKLIEEIEHRNSEYNFYKTNLVKCLPLNDKGKIRYPSIEEMNKCIENLLIEIEVHKPKVVILLGNIVYKFVDKYLKDNRIQLDNVSFVGIEHPSYISVYKRNSKEEYIKKVTNIIRKSTVIKKEHADMDER